MPADKNKIIFIGRRNNRLAKAVLESTNGENVRFISPNTSLQKILNEISKEDISGKVTVYFQVGKSGYGYDCSISQHSVHINFFSNHVKNFKYNLGN